MRQHIEIDDRNTDRPTFYNIDTSRYLVLNVLYYVMNWKYVLHDTN